MKLLTLALLASLAAAPAVAQSVYRCGNTYSQVACTQGRAVDVEDSRSPAQQAEARRVAADERQLAAQMQRDRLADAQAARPAGAASLSGAEPAPRVAALTSTAHTKKRKRIANAQYQPVEVLLVSPSPRRRGA